MLYLSKVLPLFVLPLGITIALMAAGILLRRRALVLAAAAFLWMASMPAVGDRLMRLVEGGLQRGPAATAPAADAIVVLSTGRSPAPGSGATSEWTDADRFFGGLELFKAGRAPRLVFTGGWAPWQGSFPPEGDVLAEFARGFGIPSDAIRLTGKVSNTAQEARAVAHMLRSETVAAPRVLLVTSAFHMNRATRLFTQAGIEVSAFPVDFWRTASNGTAFMSLLPNASALVQTQVAMREIYGRIYYRLVAS